MRLSLPTSRFLLSGLVLALAAAHAQAQLQVLPEYVYKISADGSRAVMGTVSPSSGGGGVSLIDVASGAITNIGGNAGLAGRPVISADGSTVLAALTGANGTNSAVYSIATGSWTPVAVPAGSSNSSLSSWSISADGRYVGGTWTDNNQFLGYVADTQTGQTTVLNGGQGRIAGITAGAQTLYGQFSSNINGSQWTRNPDGSYTQAYLPKPDAPAQNLYATTALSANGAWVAGTSFNNALPYRLNVASGEIQYFDKLPFANGAGRAVAGASAISDDGRIIVGTHTPTGATLDQAYAYIWQAAASDTPGDFKVDGSVMTLDDYFAGYGIDLDNHYNFVSVLAMSADGRVISGVALDNISGGPVGYLVSVPVPEPSSYALLGAGLGLVAWVARRRGKKTGQHAR